MDPITIALGLAQFAPQVIKWITGSDKAAEAAGTVVEIAENVTGRQGNDALEVLKTDPALALAFRQAVMEKEAELDKAYLQDTQNARARDVELAKAGVPNLRANWLTMSAVALVGVCLAVVIWQVEMPEFAKGVITLILGRALGWVEQVFSFEFGTTRQSRAKDETISKLTG